MRASNSFHCSINFKLRLENHLRNISTIKIAIILALYIPLKSKTSNHVKKHAAKPQSYKNNKINSIYSCPITLRSRSNKLFIIPDIYTNLKHTKSIFALKVPTQDIHILYNIQYHNSALNYHLCPSGYNI